MDEPRPPQNWRFVVIASAGAAVVGFAAAWLIVPHAPQQESAPAVEAPARTSDVKIPAAYIQSSDIAVEAVSRGLVTHPMAGFDADGAVTAFDLPDGLRPLMVIAIGYLGDAAAPEVAERDRLPRERRPLSAMVLNGQGNPRKLNGSDSTN